MNVAEILMTVEYWCTAAADRVPLSCLQLSQVLLSALNQDLVQFALRPGVQVNVFATRLSPGESAAGSK